jgi:hypothetical protein
LYQVIDGELGVEPVGILSHDSHAPLHTLTYTPLSPPLTARNKWVPFEARLGALGVEPES